MSKSNLDRIIDNCKEVILGFLLFFGILLVVMSPFLIPVAIYRLLHDMAKLPENFVVLIAAIGALWPLWAYILFSGRGEK